MAAIGVSEAARMVGRDVSTLHRMMKNRTRAFSVDSQGRRRLDPAELARVFDGGMAAHGAGAVQSSAVPRGDSPETVALLREAVQCRDAMLEDLRRRLDASEEERRRIQERLTGLLTARVEVKPQRPDPPATEKQIPPAGISSAELPQSAGGRGAPPASHLVGFHAPWWRRWFR